MTKKPYIYYARPQEYKRVDPSIASIILGYRDDLLKVQGKIVEIMQNHGPEAIKREKIGLSCSHGHKFDHWQAICPKCYKAEAQKWAEIELRNKHLESVIKTMLGGVEL